MRFTTAACRASAVLTALLLLWTGAAFAQNNLIPRNEGQPGEALGEEATADGEATSSARFESFLGIDESDTVGSGAAIPARTDGEALDLAPPFEFSVWRVLGSMAVVIGLIYLLYFILRKLNSQTLMAGSRNSHLRVLDQLQLGVNRSIYLVYAAGRVVLVGATEKGMERILEIDDPEEILSIMDEFKGGGESGRFGAALAEAANRIKAQK